MVKLHLDCFNFLIWNERGERDIDKLNIYSLIYDNKKLVYTLHCSDQF